MTVENEKGEKEILLDVQSFQLGYRAAIKDVMGEPRGSTYSPLVAFLVLFVIGYALFSLLLREK